MKQLIQIPQLTLPRHIILYRKTIDRFLTDWMYCCGRDYAIHLEKQEIKFNSPRAKFPQSRWPKSAQTNLICEFPKRVEKRSAFVIKMFRLGDTHQRS